MPRRETGDAPRVVVHTLSGCVHCRRALSLLRRRGIEHDVRSGDGVPGFRAALAERTGRSTVPQILIDGTPVGGASDLARLDRRGVLRVIAEGGALPAVVARRRRLQPRSSRWVAERVGLDGRVVERASGPDEDGARAALDALSGREAAR